jgi:hypothetical protein
LDGVKEITMPRLSAMARTTVGPAPFYNANTPSSFEIRVSIWNAFL